MDSALPHSLLSTNVIDTPPLDMDGNEFCAKVMV